MNFLCCYILLAALMMPFQLLAQQSSNSSAATTNASSGQISYSIGQVFSQMAENANVVSSQGVQQNMLALPNKVSQLNGNVQIFPNPVSDFLTISAPVKTGQTLEISIFNGLGQLVQRHFTEQSTYIIDVRKLANAHYILECKSDDGYLIKHAKIIKN